MTEAIAIPITGTLRATIPIRELIHLTIFGGLVFAAIYFVGTEQGATAVFSSIYVHGFVHDGRHLPCFPYN